MSTRWKAFWLCLLSAVICGLITAIDCGNLDGDDTCHVLPVRLLFPGFIEVSFWSYFLHWVHWLPGLVFGFLFAYIHYRDKYQIIIFGLSSGIFYLIAWLISSYISSDVGGGFFVGGLFAAMALLITEKILAHIKIRAEDILQTFATGIITSGVLGGLIKTFIDFVGLVGSISGGGNPGQWDGSSVYFVQSALLYTPVFAI